MTGGDESMLACLSSFPILMALQCALEKSHLHVILQEMCVLICVFTCVNNTSVCASVSGFPLEHPESCCRKG